MTPINRETEALLNAEAARINSRAFIADDPVQFPRRFSDPRDIEIAALLSAILAWGNRTMICRDINRLLDRMEHLPYQFVAEGAFEQIPPEENIHRTLFASHLQHLLRGLRLIYARYGSLDAMASSLGIGGTEAPAWHLVDSIQRICTDANGGVSCSRALPLNMATTALKRVNMALRWLVRDDGIVDMGIWHSIPKSKLFIPLDVHVGNTARALGLLDRRANDRRAVEQLTALLRTINPDDPCIYDYALFGLGIESQNNIKINE